MILIFALLQHLLHVAQAENTQENIKALTH